MTTLLERPVSSLQAPDLFGTLREVAEFGKEAGERLRAARENLGLSQFDAAVKLGVTDKTVGKWERAQAKPTRNGHWNKIEEVYGVSRREVLGEPEPEQLDRLEQKIDALLAALNVSTETAGIGDPPEGPIRRLADTQTSERDRKRQPKAREALPPRSASAD